MLVVCAFENAASGQLLATQSAVRQHTLNSQFHGEVALLGHQGAILDFLQVADVAGVVLIQLLVQLVAGENGLIGVDDDDKIASIHMGGEDRLMLASQQGGSLSGYAAQGLVSSVDHIPFAFDLVRFRHKC